MQKITPYLWFDHQAEEAVNFYTGLFKNSKIINVIRHVTYGTPVGAQVLKNRSINNMERFCHQFENREKIDELGLNEAVDLLSKYFTGSVLWAYLEL